MITTVISLIERREDRQTTLDHLKQAGLEPIVFESDPREYGYEHGHKFCNAQVSADALEFALSKNDDLLFCEDDIRLAPYFTYFLEAYVKPANQVTYLYAHDKKERLELIYPPELLEQVQKKTLIQPTLTKVHSLEYLPFTQCVYIPLWFMKMLDFADLRTGQKAIDVWLYRIVYPKMHYLPSMMLPHPVQHKGIRTGRHSAENQAFKKSQSFNFELSYT